MKRVILKNLELGVCSVDETVKFFPFQRRTFQARLKRLGVSFQELLDEVRFEKAEFYLRNSDMPLSQLADMLCYRDVSVFSSAFKKHYGVPPSSWRKQREPKRCLEPES